MANRYTHFFTDTDVPTFRVPQIIIGDVLREGMLWELSHPALRLYLAILCKCQRVNKPIVEMSSEYIERHANISEKHVSKVRKELEVISLIKATKGENGWLYEVLEPQTGGWSLPTRPPPEKNPLLTKTGGPSLSPPQIEKVFLHYLKGSQLDDDANGLVFECPFHLNDGKARKYHLCVCNSERGGPWMCHWHECKRRGASRMRATFEDGVMDLTKEKAYDGGGNVLDFIVAMVEKTTQAIISRKEAEGILTSILAS
jgi:hypothetical protein